MTGPASEAVAPADVPEAGERTAPGPEVDPFRLRGDTPRVMRLSRKALAMIGAAGGTAIGGALLWALQPVAPKTAENLYTADGANRAEVVTGAPADYGKVPKLGPPLPGDLGRPIVSAQQNGETIPVPPMGNPPAGGRSPADKARDRARLEREAATASRIFLGGGTSGAPVADAQRGSIEPVRRDHVGTRRRRADSGGGAARLSRGRLRRTVRECRAPSCACFAIHPSGGKSHSGRADHWDQVRPSRTGHGAGDPECLR